METNEIRMLLIEDLQDYITQLLKLNQVVTTESYLANMDIPFDEKVQVQDALVAAAVAIAQVSKKYGG